MSERWIALLGWLAAVALFGLMVLALEDFLVKGFLSFLVCLQILFSCIALYWVGEKTKEIEEKI